MIQIHGVSFDYHDVNEEDNAGRKPALSNVTLDIVSGEFVALLGRNGSGKSSLTRLLNGIEAPYKGEVLVDGLSTDDQAAIPAIRRLVQIVFQNPENQQVGLTVGEDIAFGLSNIGWPHEEMSDRISWAIHLVGLNAPEDRPVSDLSGGEKQKLALAAVLALAPSYLILDEATSMLDPAARRQFVATLHEVRREHPFTLIYITHHLEEVMDADRWVIFREGEIAASGTPDELATDPERLSDCGLELPYTRQLSEWLRLKGVPASSAPDIQELRRLLCESN
ncbi:ATP-binding cassette domain-containing protein [Paenibacillus sp. HN-1]|uniref:ATP-binding cassette domain-containing protein n=1 Tax=Paenibacillus TaxID=44249 RepID=UPI001CA88EDA|nr:MULTISPECIES: ATP-binding cassette domain-containing protein [Paenibacillus]MBY9078102.1 ATP-binding cassette domain-containing protein [Paenibacillus sp. CGMCC 1.18879]MBY9083843.1 ATP-binding cassette domain-containing protein [Paenibacillus sinensis]